MSTAQRGPMFNVQCSVQSSPTATAGHCPVRSVHDRRRKNGPRVRPSAHGQCTGVSVLARTIVLPLCGVSSRGVAGGGTQTAGHAARTSAQTAQDRGYKHRERGTVIRFGVAVCLCPCVHASGVRFPASVRVSCPLRQEKGKQPPTGVHGHEFPKLLGPARLPVPVSVPVAPSIPLLPRASLRSLLCPPPLRTPPVSEPRFRALAGRLGCRAPNIFPTSASDAQCEEKNTGAQRRGCHDWFS
jgi:hypothetical protein